MENIGLVRSLRWVRLAAYTLDRDRLVLTHLCRALKHFPVVLTESIQSLEIVPDRSISEAIADAFSGNTHTE